MLAEEARFETSLLCMLLPFRFCPQPTLYLPKRLELGLHYEVILAELTASSVRALDPLVETGLVDKAQGSCAATGCDERALLISFAVTDPGEGRSTNMSSPRGHCAPTLPYLSRVVLNTVTYKLEHKTQNMSSPREHCSPTEHCLAYLGLY